jgi:hypothetical protein
MEPIELLKIELYKYKKAYQKSVESLAKKEISRVLHEKHKENLTPQIEKYRHAIETLQIFG